MAEPTANEPVVQDPQPDGGTVAPVEGGGEDELKLKVREEVEAEFAKEREGLVAQIIELRKKREPAETPAPAATPTKETPEVEEVVRKVLGESQKKERERNRNTALAQFIARHKELHPANDTTGILSERLQAQLNRLNTADSYTAEDFYLDLADAYKLMSDGKPSTPESKLGEHASQPSVSGKPQSNNIGTLTSEQEALRKTKGWSVEKYLRMREKYPGVVL